jgi:hypothetical protein
VQTGNPPGWYPWGLGNRYWDGREWTGHFDQLPAVPEPAPVEQKRSLNPLFLVLTVLSAIPTAFSLLVFASGDGQSTIVGIGFLWCLMWSWVWWSMAKRYR